MTIRAKIQKLTIEQLDYLTSQYNAWNYQKVETVVYDGQVPRVGLAIIEGEIEFVKKNKIIHTIGAGNIIGAHELMSNNSFKYSLKVSPGTKVIFLDRSTIQALLQKNQNPLIALFMDVAHIWGQTP